MITRVARLAGRIGLLLLGLYVVLTGLGLLITRAAPADNPLTEDDLNRWLAEHRTGFLDGATSVLVTLGMPAVVAVATVVGVVVLRLVLGRWREPVFLVVTVASQAALVALTAQVVSREAPDVERLGPVSALGSYPSAHTAAATALLVAVTLLVGWHVGAGRSGCRCSSYSSLSRSSSGSPTSTAARTT